MKTLDMKEKSLQFQIMQRFNLNLSIFVLWLNKNTPSEHMYVQIKTNR